MAIMARAISRLVDLKSVPDFVMVVSVSIFGVRKGCSGNYSSFNIIIVQCVVKERIGLQ